LASGADHGSNESTDLYTDICPGLLRRLTNKALRLGRPLSPASASCIPGPCAQTQTNFRFGGPSNFRASVENEGADVRRYLGGTFGGSAGVQLVSVNLPDPRPPVVPLAVRRSHGNHGDMPISEMLRRRHRQRLRKKKSGHGLCVGRRERVKPSSSATSVFQAWPQLRAGGCVGARTAVVEKHRVVPPAGRE